MPWSPIGGGRGLKNSGALEATAKAHNTSTFQVALAWLLQRSPVMLPIPGTSSSRTWKKMWRRLAEINFG